MKTELSASKSEWGQDMETILRQKATVMIIIRHEEEGISL